MIRVGILGTVLLTSVPIGADAQQDPMIGAIQQMMASFQPGCQMGDGNACGAMSYIGGMANQMDMAIGACQSGNAQACNDFNQLYATMSSEYGRWSQANGMSAGPMATEVAPNYDPNNVLGPTHQDRMSAIEQFGAQNTENFNNRMSQMDGTQSQFLGMLNQ